MGSLELRQLEYFVAVAEHLHFGRAAQALSIGQPAVSQQVARLERTLGTELLDRSPRRVRLTEAGARFLPHARAVLAAVERARESIADDRSGAPLRLGTCSGLGDRLDAVLRELAQRCPETPVQLTSVVRRTRLERVAAGQLDAAFVRGPSSAVGVELVEVWADPLVAVLPAGHEFAARNPVPLKELAALPLRIVSRRANPALVDLVLSRCTEVGGQPRRLEFDDGPIETLLATIASGTPSWTVMYAAHARMIRSKRVVFRRTDPGLRMTTSLAFPESATSRRVAPLLDACMVAASVG